MKDTPTLAAPRIGIVPTKVKMRPQKKTCDIPSYFIHTAQNKRVPETIQGTGQ